MIHLAPYITAAFLGAGLVFSVQPLMGRLVLPLLGVSPAVWNTCLLFFQAMLLAGYAYTHFGIRLLGVRRHAVLHLALVAVSLALLPPAVGEAIPPTTGSPVGWLLLVLVQAVGLPFFVLSATAPLVQRWLAGSSHPAARDPYFLYAASNLGSLVGLLLYPLVLEPLTGLRAQAGGWSVAYLLFVAVLGIVALAARRDAARAPVAGDVVASTPAPHSGAAPVPATAALRWTATAAVPSALLLAVTGYVTTDVAPMPLLWMLPLAIYLATYIAAFGGGGLGSMRAARLAQPMLTLIVGAAVVAGFTATWMLPLHLAALAVVSYLAHGRLAAERPHPSHLTTFYLWISVGGAFGGVFGAIVAPMLLMPEMEYALLLLAGLLVPAAGTAVPELSRRGVLAGTAAALVVGAVVYPMAGIAWAVSATAVPAIALMLRRMDTQAPALLGAMCIFLIAMGMMTGARQGQELSRERNFFGTLRVREHDGYRRLVHGRTLHGVQSTNPAELETPTTYYSREGPLGDVFAMLAQRDERVHIGVVGVGVGTVACYDRPGYSWDLFEIDPAVIAMARNPAMFTFIDRCTPGAAVIIGDGRRALQARDGVRYDLLILDAFSSDAIPAHLLTREAFATYAQRLAGDGLLAVHISNRYLNLRPVVAANAATLGYRAWHRADSGGKNSSHTASASVVLTGPAMGSITPDGAEGWTELLPDPRFRTWTDDYTSLLPVLRWRTSVAAP
jgi:spermidine synthase